MTLLVQPRVGAGLLGGGKNKTLGLLKSRRNDCEYLRFHHLFNLLIIDERKVESDCPFAYIILTRVASPTSRGATRPALVVGGQVTCGKFIMSKLNGGETEGNHSRFALTLSGIRFRILYHADF